MGEMGGWAKTYLEKEFVAPALPPHLCVHLSLLLGALDLALLARLTRAPTTPQHQRAFGVRRASGAVDR